MCGDARTIAEGERARGRPPVMSADDRMDQILHALGTVFERQGLAGTTMSAIASEAGMSKRTLYAAVPDRDALFVAYMERLRSEFIRELTPEEHELPLAERLRRLLMPAPCSRHNGLPIAILRMTASGCEGLSESTRTCLAGFISRDRALIRAELDRAVARGEAQLDDTDQAAAILSAMVRPSIADALFDPHRTHDVRDPLRRFETGLDLFLRAVAV
ncbi:TetR/AcrR family transcriptional regulator [Palleronia sp. LCG004]|uniref:TetR/AcrR family transcriptional regulator n=1 Tax=Palleronia sp. LCG004 TaxID=3079304 RepID=UPI002943CBA9|nr:TetR/AcrR family transcriptional regulator [Palleronia sp. LCG004]WOI58066.1 TetR/AcrR family transcriptional regulator [Palleronia sp. LCG004]